MNAINVFPAYINQNEKASNFQLFGFTNVHSISCRSKKYDSLGGYKL